MLIFQVKNAVTVNKDTVKKLHDLLVANNLQTDAATFANSINTQFLKYGADFSISDNLNCQDIETSYQEYKEPLCVDVKNGFVELLAFRVLSLPLEIGLCILGIRFVLRNKVDVPKYKKEVDQAKSKKKSKGKKGKNKDGEQDDDEDSDGAERLTTGARNDDVTNPQDQNTIRNKDGIAIDDKGDGSKSSKKGCFLCCCCGSSSTKVAKKGDKKSSDAKKPT